MKKIYILTGIAVISLAILGWLIFPDKDALFPQEKEAENTEIVTQEEVSLIIDDGEEGPKTFQAEFRDGMTAFDLLEEKTEESNIVLKTKTYDIGILIEAIGDKENGEEEKYWMYYVNDEMPMVSADKKEINAEDKVEFRFEKSDW